jgi:hypothetical protein
MPMLASDTPLPLEAETTPAFVIVQVVGAPPSMPSAEPVEVTVPVLVMYRGLSAVPKITGPVVLLLIVLDIGPSLILIASEQMHTPAAAPVPD